MIAGPGDHMFYELVITSCAPLLMRNIFSPIGTTGEHHHKKQFKTLAEALLYMHENEITTLPEPSKHFMSLDLTYGLAFDYIYEKGNTSFNVNTVVICWERFPTRQQLGMSLLPSGWQTVQQWPEERVALLSGVNFPKTLAPQWVQNQVTNAAFYVQRLATVGGTALSSSKTTLTRCVVLSVTVFIPMINGYLNTNS